VGQYQDNSPASNTHGFLLSKNVFRTIGVPEAPLTAARGINSRGEIVGHSTDTNGNQAGFLQNKSNFTAIQVPGAVLQGAVGTVATGLNPRGDIVGYYEDSAGNLHGFLTSKKLIEP